MSDRGLREKAGHTETILPIGLLRLFTSISDDDDDAVIKSLIDYMQRQGIYTSVNVETSANVNDAEDAFFETTYGITLTEFLEKYDEYSDQITKISKGELLLDPQTGKPIEVTQVSEIILPPSETLVPSPTGEGEGLKPIKFLGKTQSVINNLYANGIGPENITIYEGILTENQMRKVSYKLLHIKQDQIDRVVLVCDQHGEATFVFDTKELINILNKKYEVNISSSDLSVFFNLSKLDIFLLLQHDSIIGRRIITRSRWQYNLMQCVLRDIDWKDKTKKLFPWKDFSKDQLTSLFQKEIELNKGNRKAALLSIANELNRQKPGFDLTPLAVYKHLCQIEIIYRNEKPKPKIDWANSPELIDEIRNVIEQVRDRSQYRNIRVAIAHKVSAYLKSKYGYDATPDAVRQALTLYRLFPQKNYTYTYLHQLVETAKSELGNVYSRTALAMKVASYLNISRQKAYSLLENHGLFNNWHFLTSADWSIVDVRDLRGFMEQQRVLLGTEVSILRLAQEVAEYLNEQYGFNLDMNAAKSGIERLKLYLPTDSKQQSKCTDSELTQLLEEARIQLGENANTRTISESIAESIGYTPSSAYRLIKKRGLFKPQEFKKEFRWKQKRQWLVDSIKDAVSDLETKGSKVDKKAIARIITAKINAEEQIEITFVTVYSRLCNSGLLAEY